LPRRSADAGPALAPEILAANASVTGLGLSGIRWYQAFAARKTAVVMQQLYDHYLRGETSDERMASPRDQVPELAVRARRLQEV
jgi:aminoglycoside phosphotransferase (APT) family kinase protein